MPDLTRLLGRPVLDVNGRRVGRLIDLVACAEGESPYREVISLVVKQGRTTLDVPFSAVAVFDAPAIPLNRPLEALAPHGPHSGGLCLAEDLLGKEVCDRKSGRAIRIGDVGLLEARNRLWATTVKDGGRRIPKAWTANALVRGALARLGRRPVGRAIPWSDVEWISGSPMAETTPGPEMAGRAQE